MTFYDFHLHWYPGYQIDRFGERLQSLSKEYTTIVGVIYDTELVDCWSLFQIAWQFLPLNHREESDSRLYGELDGSGVRVVFYRGVQAVSEENVEMLVIGEVPDTSTLNQMVENALETGGAVILPWGFGKWRGARAKLVLREFRESRERLYVSDSANRPNRGMGASLLSGAYRDLSKLSRLDGSDPLPMSDDEDFSFTIGMTGEDLGSLPNDSLGLAEFLPELVAGLRPVSGVRRTAGAFVRQLQLRKNGLTLQEPYIPNNSNSSDAGDIESATDRYARRFSGSVGSYFLRRQKNLTLKLAQAAGAPPGAVLDVGGGHAQLAPHFLDLGWSVSIFSSDDSCRKRPDRIMGSENYRFATGDLLRMPYPDNSFDIVTLFRLVPHETDWESLIGEAARVSRGVVILDYPDLRSFNAFSRVLFLFKKAIEKDTRDYELFNRRKIGTAMTNAGLEDLRWRPQFFLPMALYRLAGSGRLASIMEEAFLRVGLTTLFGSPVIVSGRKRALR